MQTDPVYAISNGEELTVMYPLLLQGLSNFFAIPDNAIMHPTLFAGWVGFFITALNLLPIGQLDGGHIVKAILKDKQKYASWAMVIIIFALSFYYTGWLIFAFIILFLIGTSHQPPLNEYTPLDKKRKILGLIALIIFIVCFAPIPMSV
jgi:membrane-associated protease RseP (regulator of RpoE activity)